MGLLCWYNTNIYLAGRKLHAITVQRIMNLVFWVLDVQIIKKRRSAIRRSRLFGTLEYLLDFGFRVSILILVSILLATKIDSPRELFCIFLLHFRLRERGPYGDIILQAKLFWKFWNLGVILAIRNMIIFDEKSK